MTAVVEARGLVKTYGEITAVDHVDLTVEPGDVYGYLGPNGAGKTTSLRMLLGLIRPSSGSARLFGRDPMIDGVRALDGVAGFVEAPRFYPYLSGRKNLELVAALDGGDARCCCWTSRRPVSTRPGCATCGRSSARWPTAVSRCCSRAT
jgi:ABC-2 type transport system ATP-binding protein